MNVRIAGKVDAIVWNVWLSPIYMHCWVEERGLGRWTGLVLWCGCGVLAGVLLPLGWSILITLFSGLCFLWSAVRNWERRGREEGVMLGLQLFLSVLFVLPMWGGFTCKTLVS